VPRPPLGHTSNSNGVVEREGYYVLTDGMSNGHYSANGMTSYSLLPYENKFGFVTLSCRCKSVMGGASNAHLDVAAIDNVNPRTMEVEEALQYDVMTCLTYA